MYCGGEIFQEYGVRRGDKPTLLAIPNTINLSDTNCVGRHANESFQRCVHFMQEKIKNLKVRFVDFSLIFLNFLKGF